MTQQNMTPSDMEPQNILETERLAIRRLTPNDFDALLDIMKKPEVMYAWEHGFTEEDVHNWIDRQLARYSTDGIGYFAVTLKENGRLIGQAGLMKTTMNGTEVTEIGYIFDNFFWHHGYATEAARALTDYAFTTLGLPALYCSIRPENQSSLRVADRLGMTPSGTHIVNYRGKEMVHVVLKRDRE